MKFSREEIEVLEKCAFDKVRVIVRGANGSGQHFEIEGCIGMDVDRYGKKQAFIKPYSLGLFLGQTKKYNDINDFNLFVPLLVEDDISYDDLCVETIIEKESNAEIYRNSIFNTTINACVEHYRQDEIVGNWLNTPLTEYGEELKKLIGKPVIYNNEDRVVIKSIWMVNGAVRASLTNGYIMQCPIVEMGDIKLDKKAKKELDQYEQVDIVNV